MKTKHKNLLPTKDADRDAPSNISSNIKPRFKKRRQSKKLHFSEGLRRLSNISRSVLVFFVVIFLFDYQPVLAFPPLQQNQVKAEEKPLTQKQEVIADSSLDTQLPHPGYLSTSFSRYHQGIDLATGYGTPIHPIADGVVEAAFYGYFGYGNHVIISHEKGFKSLYGHMSNIYVAIGQTVQKNTTLGTVGLTGFTSGPHTHLEITQNGTYLDPQNLLPPIPDTPSAEYLSPYGDNN